MKLKQKVHRIFLLISVAYIVCLFVAFAIFYQKQMLDAAKQNLLYDVTRLTSSLGVRVEKMNAFSRTLMIDDEIMTYLKGDPDEERFGYSNALDSIYDNMSAYSEISSVYIIRNDYEYLSAIQGVIQFDRKLIRNPEWKKEIDAQDGGYVLRINGDGAFIPQRSGDVISLIRNINDIHTFSKRGMLVVNFDVRLFEETTMSSIDVANEQRNYYIFDGKGDMFCHVGDGAATYKGEVSTYLLDDEGGFTRKTLSCSMQIPETDMCLVATENFVIWDNLSYNLLLIAAVLVALIVIMMLILDRLLAIYITIPINKLAQTMGSVKEGWLRRVSLKTRDDEIGMLKDSYNEMLIEMNNLIEQLIEKEQNMRKSEMDVLQQQIKPHFLYNTIEMIASLAMDEDKDREQVYDALVTLGSFYRQFLSHGNELVTVATELEITKKYLKLQKLRYRDIFTDEYEIDESCLDFKLPRLTIQPLVENCLYHGIRLKGEHGVIRITIQQREGAVYCEVYDSGIGMNPATIKRVLSEERHFGLKGTLERVRYHSGMEDCYQIESVEGEYTKIILCLGTIPLQKITEE